MITNENYHYLHRIAKRTIPYLKKENRFTKVLKSEHKYDKEYISDLIKSEKPFMVARFGSTESEAIINFIEIQKKHSDFTAILKHLKGELNIYWKKHHNFINNLCSLSGFFPNNNSLLNEFVEIYLNATKNLDILGIWNGLEEYIPNIPDNTKLVHLRELEPWFYDEPWSQYLEGKKVLVIHPFEADIKQQYAKNTGGGILYKNTKILPSFELKTIKAVQTIAGEKNSEFKTWFDALNHMKTQIDNTDFDITIIGCGAYGFPLASYIKEIGKQAIHLGGVTQLLFGIKGQRWEQWEQFTNLRYDNGKNWIFPTEKPKDYKKVEGGCYW